MYAFTCDVALPFDQAVEKFKAALAAERMGVVSEVNVQQVMKAKLDVDIPAYTILGACAPGLARRVIETEPNAGAMLPCGVTAMALDTHNTRFSFQDPESLLGLTGDPGLLEVGREAKAILYRVKERLGQ
ncbi:MAG TPA: DUF302 domain-containing protein [Thiobacillaceae bacterium]|nr:DUF302 domain-containing protein [Thiobacillaceae bacterium]HNU63412.1 DUF302 domain-containing protein [Thiobacillaceae bacterium]